MGLFNRDQDPPDVSKLREKKDRKGLLQAMTYGDRRKRKTGEDYGAICQEVASVELSAALALADLGEVAAAHQFVERIRRDHGWNINGLLAEDPWNPYSVVLARFGEPAVVPALELLQSRYEDECGFAAAALGHMGPAAAKALSALTAFAGNREQSRGSRACAMWALGRIGTSPEAVPVLIAAIRETMGGRDVLCRRAVQALGSGRYGPVAADALAVLLEDTEEAEYPAPSYGAILALCLIGDRRGMEAFLRQTGKHGWRGDPEMFATVGVFEDERVKQVLTELMQAEIKRIGTGSEFNQQMALMHAVYAAVGLLVHQDKSAAYFLIESLATKNLTILWNWVTEERGDALAMHALRSQIATAREAFAEFRAQNGEPFVNNWLANSSAPGKASIVKLLEECGDSARPT